MSEEEPGEKLDEGESSETQTMEEDAEHRSKIKMLEDALSRQNKEATPQREAPDVLVTEIQRFRQTQQREVPEALITEIQHLREKVDYIERMATKSGWSTLCNRVEGARATGVRSPNDYRDDGKKNLGSLLVCRPD